MFEDACVGGKIVKKSQEVLVLPHGVQVGVRIEEGRGGSGRSDNGS